MRSKICFPEQWNNVGTVPYKKTNICIPVFYEPFSWIVFDILPYFVVILLIADHIVIIGTLKNRFSNFFCHKHLDRTHNIGHPIMLLFAPVGVDAHIGSLSNRIIKWI